MLQILIEYYCCSSFIQLFILRIAFAVNAHLFVLSIYKIINGARVYQQTLFTAN